MDILDEIEANKNDQVNRKKWIIISLLPVLFWPMIFYFSIFLFNDFNADPRMQSLLFYGINAYPLYLIVNTIIASRIVKKQYALAIFLYSWPLALVILFLCWIFL